MKHKLKKSTVYRRAAEYLVKYNTYGACNAIEAMFLKYGDVSPQIKSKAYRRYFEDIFKPTPSCERFPGSSVFNIYTGTFSNVSFWLGGTDCVLDRSLALLFFAEIVKDEEGKK